MNVQSIRLENWKKFTDPVEIKLKEGLNVLYGPNESGKSTLIDSIITTFYSKHTSGSEKIKTLKPWGTSLQPRSTITFSKDGQNYRISKGFQEKKSLLKKQEGESWRKIAEGDRADQEFDELGAQRLGICDRSMSNSALRTKWPLLVSGGVGAPMPRATTAAWLVMPPRAVRMPFATSMP